MLSSSFETVFANESELIIRKIKLPEYGKPKKQLDKVYIERE